MNRTQEEQRIVERGLICNNGKPMIFKPRGDIKKLIKELEQKGDNAKIF